MFFAHQAPSADSGGAPWVAWELFRAAQARGLRAQFVAAAMADEGHGPPLRKRAGSEAQYLFTPGDYAYPLFSVGDPLALAALREHVTRFAPDVLHFHHYHALGLESIAVARAAAPRAVLVVTFHEMMAICLAEGRMVTRDTGELCRDSAPMRCQRCFPELSGEMFRIRRSRLEAVFAICDGFVFPSAFLARRYEEWGLDVGRSIVIPNGLRALSPAVLAAPASSGVSRFGFFGQRLDHKGLDVALSALCLLARQGRVPPGGLTFEIHGGGAEWASAAFNNRIAGLLAELGRVSLGAIKVLDAGPYRRDELPRRMGGVDWVVAPSNWWEVFGLVVSEAWMLGRPVIASAIGGLAERIRDGVDGLLFAPGDAAALADVFALAAGDGDLWRRLAGNIAPQPGPGEMLDAHRDFYAARAAARS